MPVSILHTPAQEQHVVAQSFIDNPQVDYYALFEQAGGIENALGAIEGEVEIGIVGLGTSGCFGGGHLARAGAKVTANELASEAGGRLKSIKVGEKNVFELGGMRFPPCETLLYLSASLHGFGFIPGFPDPGVYPTLIVSTAQKLNMLWDDPDNPPEDVLPIISAFFAIDATGVTKDGKQLLCSLGQMRSWLQSPDPDVRMLVVPEWQKWIDVFRHNTFEELVRRLWGEKEHEWDLPGGVAFSEATMKLFGDLGFGSGGFKDLFDRSGTCIMKILANGLEHLQSIFAKKDADGILHPAATQDLVRAQCSSAVAAGMTCMFETELTDVNVVYGNAGRKIELEYTNKHGEKTCHAYDAVVLTLGLRTPLMQRLAKRRGADRLFSDELCDAILQVDVMASTKLFNLVPKHSKKRSKGYLPRNVLSDTAPSQMYTLDYGDAETMAVLEEYTWNAGSRIIEHLTAQELHDKIIGNLEKITKDTPFAGMPERFQSLSIEQLVKIDWQKEAGFNGAFVLAGRSQDKLVSAMVYDFLKLKKDPNALPIFVASEWTTHESGWVDAGLRSMTNAVTALIDHFGKLKNPELAPVHVMTENLYHY